MADSSCLKISKKDLDFMLNVFLLFQAYFRIYNPIYYLII